MRVVQQKPPPPLPLHSQEIHSTFFIVASRHAILYLPTTLSESQNVYCCYLYEGGGGLSKNSVAGSRGGGDVGGAGSSNKLMSIISHYSLVQLCYKPL